MENQKQTIYIVGAGAIGKVLAVLLALAHKEVIILRGRVDGQASRREKMRVELSDNTTLEAEVEVSTLSNFSNLNGLVILTNKSFGNKSLAQALKDKIQDSPIVLLQNGLEVEQPFVDSGFPEIYRCVLFATSQSTAQDTYRFKPVSASLIGIIKGSAKQLNTIVRQLHTHRFPFQEEENIQPVIWKKAIVNSVFNSICPLLEVDNGIFHRDEQALTIAKRVIKECVGVATEKGVAISQEEVVESLLLISKASDGQLISTLQDIKNQRPTEIDTLNFAIVDMAKKLNQEDRVVETKLLGELTKLKSEIKG
uniref:2-dehydropantoate 2-reductase n=1 Tax=Roseihalotalea indica TaxID=2867963 RepID=A0AA49JJD4_9BACT|nr:2-dehydropantoate 2-reductase [Tunicatimonas sp. TK19036]